MVANVTSVHIWN